MKLDKYQDLTTHLLQVKALLGEGCFDQPSVVHDRLGL